MIEKAEQVLNVSSSKMIIVSGMSAGGMASGIWSNYINNYFKKKNPAIKVVTISDSPLFFDLFNEQTQRHSFTEDLKLLLKFSNQEVLKIDDFLKEYFCFLTNPIYIKNYFIEGAPPEFTVC